MCAAIGAPDRPQALVVDDSQVALCRSACLCIDHSNVPFALICSESLSASDKVSSNVYDVREMHAYVQVDRFVLKRLLEDLGFVVVVAGDGQEAVHYYMEHADSITCIWMVRQHDSYLAKACMS